MDRKPQFPPIYQPKRLTALDAHVHAIEILE